MTEYARLTEPLLEKFRQRELTFDYDAIDGFKTYDTLLNDLRGKLNLWFYKHHIYSFKVIFLCFSYSSEIFYI